MSSTSYSCLRFEPLEQKLALSAMSFVDRPDITAPEVVLINNAVVGPSPLTFEKADFFGESIDGFVVGHVASGVVQKYDADAAAWRDISSRPESVAPHELLKLLADRVIGEKDQIRWLPGGNNDLREAFMVLGWNNGEPLPATDRSPSLLPTHRLHNLVVELADSRTEFGSGFDLAWFAALQSEPRVEPTHFYPVTEINGAAPEGEMKPLQNVKSLVPPNTIDAFGRQVVVHRGIRELGTRVGIHIHEYGGYTLVLSGEITDFVEGLPNKTYGAGEWYYMPPNTPMAAANLGTEDAELIDIFLVPPGQPEITIIEPNWPSDDADGVRD